MASMTFTLGAVAVGLALAVGVACRSCKEAPPGPLLQRSLTGATHSGVQEQRVVVARDAAAWNAVWREHGGLQIPSPEAPSVDFEREMVVAVFLGERGSGGYGVTIEAIERTSTGLLVKARETKPGPDDIVTMALTSPMHAVAVERVPGDELELVLSE